MQNFTKICHIGCSSNGDIYVQINYKGGELSIIGVNNGGYGQIQNSIARTELKHNEFGWGWDKESVDKFIQIWNRWHFNHMNPGTPAQMIIIRHFKNLANKEDPLHMESPHAYAKKKGFDYYYDLQLYWLRSVNMESHDGYKFGTKWLFEEVPKDVLEWLYGLIEAKNKPRCFG